MTAMQTMIRALGATACTSALLVLLTAGTSPAADSFETMFGSHIKALGLVDSMQSAVLQASMAEKGAVMAETDEESEVLAAEVRRHGEDVERLRQEARALFRQRKWTQETALLDEFERCWEEYRKLDNEILELAVQNTNLKASSLSHGKGIELLRRFGKALDGIKDMAGTSPGPGVSGAACRAMIAAQRIQILHSPHIDEADLGRMDEIEREMRSLDAEVGEALQELQSAAGPGAAAEVRAAMDIYEEYGRVTRQIVTDSRLNTNVLSLSLSLGQKRKVTAHCIEILQAMRDVVKAREFKGTR